MTAVGLFRRAAHLAALVAEAVLGDPPATYGSPFGPVATGVVRPRTDLAGTGSPRLPARFPRSTQP